MMKLLSYSPRSEKKKHKKKKAFNFKRQPRLHALLYVQSAQEEPRLEMDSASRRLVRKGKKGHLPSRELTYPTWGSLENHRLKMDFSENMLVPRRVTLSIGNLYLDKVL